MSVKVAVRVRPFNQRELNYNQTCCIEMENNKTIITDVKTQNSREFNFDYSFWSHDGYSVEDSGLYIPKNDKYCDQKAVYNAVGTEILKNSWEGYHCCLFAYGQTGSGKSYSMVGYGPNKGFFIFIH